MQLTDNSIRKLKSKLQTGAYGAISELSGINKETVKSYFNNRATSSTTEEKILNATVKYLEPLEKRKKILSKKVKSFLR